MKSTILKGVPKIKKLFGEENKEVWTFIEHGIEGLQITAKLLQKRSSILFTCISLLPVV